VAESAAGWLHFQVDPVIMEMDFLVTTMTISNLIPNGQIFARLRVLLVDDMPQVLNELHQLLELTGLIEIIAEARNGAEAVRLAAELAPDAIVMDLEMPGMDGYEATRQIRQCQPSPRVVILSVHAGPVEQERARAAGADSFVEKGADYEILLNAVLGKNG
jgi:two-component system response regulator DegU